MTTQEAAGGMSTTVRIVPMRTVGYRTTNTTSPLHTTTPSGSIAGGAGTHAAAGAGPAGGVHATVARVAGAAVDAGTGGRIARGMHDIAGSPRGRAGAGEISAAMIVVMAVIVGFIIIAVIQPIYGSYDAIATSY